MTNHIEQLMKAAGVVPVHLTDCSFVNIRKGYEIVAELKHEYEGLKKTA